MHSLLRDAGLGELRLEQVVVPWRFEDVDDYRRFVTELAGGIAMLLQNDA